MIDTATRRDQAEDRQPALDGIRAIAILLVLQYHVFYGGIGLIPKEDGHLVAVDQFVINLFGSGWVGVDLFFVLSGFLITGILLRAKEGLHYFRSFYARRFLRIFPLYYLFLMFIFFIYPLLRDLDRSIYLQLFDVDAADRIWFMTYTQNIPMSIPNLRADTDMPMIHLWSLAVEEQFYVIWPLVVLCCPRRVLPLFCGLVMLCALLLRLYMVLGSASWVGEFAPYFFTPARIDTLAAGAFVACLVEYQVRQEVRLIAVAIAAASTLVLGAMAFADGRLDAFDDMVMTYGYSLLALLFASCLFLVATNRRPLAFLTGAVLGSVATYSYAIYVVHPLIFSEIAIRVQDAGGLPDVGGSYLPSLVVLDFLLVSMSFAVGWLSWHLYEKHFLKLKRLFPYGKANNPPRQAEPAAVTS